MKKVTAFLFCISVCLLLIHSPGNTQSSLSSTKENGPQEIRECEGNPAFVYTVCMGTSAFKCLPTQCMPAFQFKHLPPKP